MTSLSSLKQKKKKKKKQQLSETTIDFLRVNKKGNAFLISYRLINFVPLSMIVEPLRMVCCASHHCNAFLIHNEGNVCQKLELRFMAMETKASVRFSYEAKCRRYSEYTGRQSVLLEVGIKNITKT